MNIDDIPDKIENMAAGNIPEFIEWLQVIGEFVGSLVGVEQEEKFTIASVEVPTIGGLWAYIKGEDNFYQVSYVLDLGNGEFLESSVEFYKTKNSMSVSKSRNDLKPLVVATHYVDDAVDRTLSNNKRR